VALLFYANLVHNFAQEILDGGEATRATGTERHAQEIINAVERSHRGTAS
jgi:hypothetical protein